MKGEDKDSRAGCMISTHTSTTLRAIVNVTPKLVMAVSPEMAMLPNEHRVVSAENRMACGVALAKRPSIPSMR